MSGNKKIAPNQRHFCVRRRIAAGRIAERRSATRSKIQTRPLQFSNQAIGSGTGRHRNFSNAL
jgi:hypothetical protein